MSWELFDNLVGSCNGLATIIGGLIAYGCVDGQEKIKRPTMASWRIMALCLGLVSILYGVCMRYFMAGSVVTAKFFSKKEKTLAVCPLCHDFKNSSWSFSSSFTTFNQITWIRL
jgi:MFS family permease